jgi:hypothetical protein
LPDPALSLERGVPWKFYVLSGVALLASALSKESGLVFACLAIMLILLTKKWKALPAFGVALIFVVTIYATLRNQVPPVEVPQLSPPAPALVRPIIAARALAEYAGVVIAPVNLHMERDVENHPWGYNPASLTAGRGANYKRSPALSFSVCCCGGCGALGSVRRQSSRF